jgi:hypothetical protein
VLDMSVSKLGGLFDAPLEGLVMVADKFEVNANADSAHNYRKDTS